MASLRHYCDFEASLQSRPPVLADENGLDEDGPFAASRCTWSAKRLSETERVVINEIRNLALFAAHGYCTGSSEHCTESSENQQIGEKYIKQKKTSKDAKMWLIFASFLEKESRCGASFHLSAKRNKDVAHLCIFR